jgi:hypothetical protein
MKKYKQILNEKTINQLHKDIDILYNHYKSKFDRLTDLVKYISNMLHTTPNTVLQILELIEKRRITRR